MNTQKQVTLMVALVFALIGGCAAYTVYDQPREESAARSQDAIHAERGARIFARYCRECHGDAGEGRIGPALNVLYDPAQLAQRQLSVGDIKDTISCGRVGKIMPSWLQGVQDFFQEGGALTPEQIDDLVTLITTNAGDGWKKAADFSAIENQAAPARPVDEVLASSSITGATKRVCGQLAPATETPPSGPPAGVNPATTWTENATDNKFDVTAMVAPAGQAVTVSFNNKGAAIHNWHVLNIKDDGGKDITVPLTDGGKSATVTFTLSKEGSYKFQCDVHPTEMTGTLFVVGASATTGGAQASGTASGPSTVAPGAQPTATATPAR